MTKKQKPKKTQNCPNYDCQLEYDYKGKKMKGQSVRCPDCKRTIILKALMIAVLTLGFGTAAYAEVANFQVDTEFLNATRTSDSGNKTLSDGTIKKTISAEWDYIYPNQESLDKNPEPIKADRKGTFFELIIEDGAKFFSSLVKPLIPDIEPEDEEAETEPDKIRKLTKPEQEALNRLKDECPYEGGQDKALAFQGVYQIFLDHPIEWYALTENQDARNLKTEECKGLEETQKIANATIGSRVTNETSTFIFTPTDQTKKNDFDFSVGGELWQQRNQSAFDHAQTLTHYGQTWDKPFQGDPVVTTNVTAKTAEQKAHEKHVVIEETRKTAQITKCTDYWQTARDGKAPLRQWDEELKVGRCDGFVFEMIDGKEVPVMIQEILAEKIRNGDTP